MKVLILASEGLRMFFRSVIIKFRGVPRYEGDAEQICKTIVERCWNREKEYYVVSTGNYPEFYMRDFGMVIDSLLKLGHKERVRKTLEYALQTFQRNNILTTSISPSGKPFDFPDYAPDSLAFMLHSLDSLGHKALFERYRDFLNRQILLFFEKVVEKETGLPKEAHFSSMKDYALRKRSCYDLCMCYMVQKYSSKNGLDNPLKDYDYKKLIMQHYWKGTHFADDLSHKKYVAGDANVLPFWTGLVDDRKLLLTVIDTLQYHKLDRPFPLRYTHEDNTEVDMHWLEFFVRDWERHVAWMHLGYMYIKIVLSVDKRLAKKYLLLYKESIGSNKNHLEVFNPNGKPYKSMFYYSSDSMIWAANYLAMLDE